MNDKNMELAANLIPSTYVFQGRDAIKRRERLVTELLSHRKLPETGWDDETIEWTPLFPVRHRLLLKDLSMMDSNNFLGNSGVGEREGRIESALVVFLLHSYG